MEVNLIPLAPLWDLSIPWAHFLNSISEHIKMNRHA